MKKIFSTTLIAVTILSSSCDSTGICTEPVTPRLMIGFSDLNNLGNEEEVNPPENLVIYGIKDGFDIIGSSDDSKYLYPNVLTSVKNRIPLIFDVDRDELTYVLMFKSTADQANVIYDTIKLNYFRNQEFVNVECGYRCTFSNVQLSSSKNNITKAELLTDQIDDDAIQHIKILLK